MIIAFVAAILALFTPIAANAPIIAAPIVEDIDAEWDAFHADAMREYADEFTALFNATEFKVAKNGRSMVKSANARSFKFAPTAK